MIKIYCDKCGKEIDEFEEYTILIQGPVIRAWEDEYMYDKKGYQICRNCIKSVANFIAKERMSEVLADRKNEQQTDGILFKGNLKEGDYKLIKTTNGWVLEGNDIAYYGEPQTERSSE